jgi:hypothetical protein
MEAGMTPVCATSGPARLKIGDTHETQYCVPLFVRDEQVRLSTARIARRIEQGPTTDAPIAVVGFGPSLADTWEQILAFPTVISCSGAHKFLVDRGIVPTFHVEVDPRPHKVTLMGLPQPGCIYYIASACSPKLFDHLEAHGADVRLWHIYATDAEAKRMLPPGEWALTGGPSVGLRAMAIARFLGYTQQHVFGMDGCMRETSHAAEHPNSPPQYREVEYPEGSGVLYRTTQSMLEVAKATWHELNQLHDVQATFYGEGLVQAMAKAYIRTPAKDAGLGVRHAPTISPEYRALNAQLHRENVAYGVGGGRHAPTVAKLCEQLKTHSVLDYGCGKGYLAKALEFPIWEFDPCVPGKDERPRPADIVCCTDVLEHVEPDNLGATLADLARVTKKVAYLVIHTGPASKTLADGRNAHLIQQGEPFWRAALAPFFDVAQCFVKGQELHVVAAPKRKVKAA